MMQYQRAGQANSMTSQGGVEESGELVEHNGKVYRRVQIESDDQEYLMDEEGNIYDLQYNRVGRADDEDLEDAF